MSRLQIRWTLIAALVLTGSWAVSPRPSLAISDEMAAVESLKSEAFRALRDGRFDRTSELIAQAAEMSRDPMLTKMADWINQFESQRLSFAAERLDQYEQAVANVELLIDNGKEAFAIIPAKTAYLLAEDKEAFHQQPWVQEVIENTIRTAEQYEVDEEWFKALRLYSELGSIEPANPQWKEKLKLMTRRVRLLALYTPDQLKSIRKSEADVLEQVEALMNPDADPPRRDLDEDNDEASAFRIEWQETLRGISMDMLWDSRGNGALNDARNNYYRDVSYRDLAIGGLRGLQAIATTRGLEDAFPYLADPQRREAYLSAVEQSLREAEQSTPNSERNVLDQIVSRMQRVNRQTVQLPEAVLVSEFADGAFAELDPFSSMIWPYDLEEFTRTTSGEFSGVGIQIQSDDDGSLKVVSPLEDSPAYRAGIKAGDIITHINGKNAKGITLNQAVRHITGPSGTTVALTVRSTDGTSREYTIRRETIKVSSIKGWQHRPGGGWDYLVDPEQKIGYIRLTNFTRSTSSELEQAVAEMKRSGAKAMILDLRYNPGGLLTSATEVADKFLRDGDIVRTRAERNTPHPPSVARARTNHDEIDLPTVVLVNQYSASASEIVAGALKDHSRARVVGERTFGKGSVQMVFPLGRLGNQQAALKLTTSHYYLPSGRNIHRDDIAQEWGVDPDLVIEMTPEQMRAAISARQELDVLREAIALPAEGEQRKLEDVADEVEEAVKEQVAQDETLDPLAADPQLSAALLLLRLELAGAQL